MFTQLLLDFNRSIAWKQKPSQRPGSLQVSLTLAAIQVAGDVHKPDVHFSTVTQKRSFLLLQDLPDVHSGAYLTWEEKIVSLFVHRFYVVPRFHAAQIYRQQFCIHVIGRWAAECRDIQVRRLGQRPSESSTAVLTPITQAWDLVLALPLTFSSFFLT